jgi:hypothetical protein
MKTTMKLFAVFLGAVAAWGQQVTISDNLPNAVGGGDWTGRITVTLNSPGRASYGSVALSGWQYVVCVGTTGSDCSTTTVAGVVTLPLYATTTLTPNGLSYSARYQPTKGAARTETWVVEPSDATLAGIITSDVPTPTTTFQTSQLLQGSATSGQCLAWSGTAWAPAACASGGGSGTVTSVAATVPSILSVAGSPITTSGTLALSLATQTANTIFAGPTSGGAATPTFRALASADIPANAANTSGNAATATALAANGANCSAGSFPLGVDASGASETCTALPTTISGTANEITASASTGAVTLSLPSTVNLSAKTLRVPNGIFLPGACTVGDAYMDTDATTGARWYLCESTNTWVVQGAASGGSVLRTTYASLPACGGSNTNYQYVLTDSIYSAHCNGSSYAYWSGQKYIPTLPWSNGTTFGTGATVTATTGSVLFDAGSPTGGDSIRAAIKAIPTAPYTIILDFDMSQAGAVGSSSCGLVITDGTTAASNKVITLMQSYIGLNMTKLTNATTWNSNYIAYAQATSRNKFSLRLVDDNTNRTWSTSTDRINWTQVSQQSRADFLTASHYGYGCNMTGVSGYVTMVVEGLYAQ